jgi:hypothetical protein
MFVTAPQFMVSHCHIEAPALRLCSIANQHITTTDGKMYTSCFVKKQTVGELYNTLKMADNDTLNMAHQTNSNFFPTLFCTKQAPFLIQWKTN